MPGTNYTTNLRLANPSLNDTGWGTTVSNGMIDLTDQAIAGQASVDVSGAGPFVLTMPDGTSGDARNMFLRFTGNPGGAREVQVPTNRKLYFVTNDSDGAVTVKVSGQTGVVVPVGASMALRINAAGTDVAQALTHQASLTLGTALVATSGGTGQTGYAVGDLLYASSTTALSKLAAGATNAVLTIAAGIPTWAATLGVASGGTGATTLTGYVKGNGTGAMTASATVPVADLTGTLPVANGGTGAATLAANNVLLGNGTSAVQTVAPGTAGNLLTSNGTTWTSAPAPAGGVTSLNSQTGAVVTTGFGDIGSVAVLMIATNTNLAVGDTIAGSDLRHSWTANFGAMAYNGYTPFANNYGRSSAVYNGGGTALTGTWRKVSSGNTYFSTGGAFPQVQAVCCGFVIQTTSFPYVWAAALYVRVS